MFNQQPRIRANVTVEDRRAVYVMAMGRKPADVAKVPHEQFLRNALKDRLNWSRRRLGTGSGKDRRSRVGRAVDSTR